MNTLQQIGFYTLSDERAENVSATSPMMRCEMILTNSCNFRCPYCRGLRPDCQGDMDMDTAIETLEAWIADGLKNAGQRVARSRSAVGERGGNSVLAACQVQEISHSQLSGRKLATIYGISRSQVGRIKRKETWKFLLDKP